MELAQDGQGADVVQEPRSPVTTVVGRFSPPGADPRGDQAVDPVGAAVAEEETSAPSAARKASWSRIGMLEAV